ncbi:DUF624 domain-containing protein [Streptococcus ovuberis]
MEWLHIAVLFILLNILWVFGCIIGLGIFGLIPSTVATMDVIKDRMYFKTDYSYFEIMKHFFKCFSRVFKHHKLVSFVPSVLLIVFMLEWFLIRGVAILRAGFIIPITLIIFYLIIMILNSSYLMTVEKNIDLSYAKFIVLSPLVFLKSSLVIVISLITFFILSISYPLLNLFSVALFIFTVHRVLKMDYAKKGWGVLE